MRVDWEGEAADVGCGGNGPVRVFRVRVSFSKIRVRGILVISNKNILLSNSISNGCHLNQVIRLSSRWSGKYFILHMS